jgi:hypothetical protein
MQSFTHGEYTVHCGTLPDDVWPMALGMACDGGLLLICRDLGDAGGLWTVLEVQVCGDCGTLQRTEGEACLVCGGTLDWDAGRRGQQADTQ